MKLILRKWLFLHEPAAPAAYAITLLGWSAGMVLFFSVPVFYLFFSFCAIGGGVSYFSMGLWLASLSIETVLAVYALWAVNRFYYRQLASPRAFAACWLAALAGAVILTCCDNNSNSPIFAALIPTYLRREVWLDGKFIPVILLTPFLAESVLLPYLTGWRKQHLTATTAATLLSIIAVGFGILGLGMFGNYFKYFSLGAISDLHSPVWEIPHAVEISLLLSFGAALAATGFRLYFWRAIAGIELRHRLPSIIRRSTLIAVALYLVATLLAAAVNANIARKITELRPLPETISQHEISDDTTILLNRLSSSIFVLSFDSRLPLIPDPEDAARLEKAIAGQSELLATIDRFTADQPQVLPSDMRYRQAAYLLLRIARIQAMRLTAALYRHNLAESHRLYDGLTSLIRHQTEFLAIGDPRLAFALDVEWLNRSEEMLHCDALSATEFAAARALATAAPERLERQRQLGQIGMQRQILAEWDRISVIVPLLSPQSWFHQLNQPLLLASREALNRLPIFTCEIDQASTAVAERYRALLEAFDFAAPPPVREGEITRQVYDIFENDIASHNSRPYPKLQKCRYRQFGTGENNIILIEKNGDRKSVK